MRCCGSSPEQRRRGVIAASAGNHAQGIAYHGSLLGIPVTVVMPVFAPLIKVTNCRQLGAKVVLHGADLTEARAHAGEIAARDGLTFIHPFDNADVIAGQGTMGLEILEQAPGRRGDRRAGRRRRSDRRHRHRGQGEAARGADRRRRAGTRRVPHRGAARGRADAVELVADAGRRPRRRASSATLPFPLVRASSTGSCTVDEASIALAILRLIELEKSVVEGAGAAPLAAFLAGQARRAQGPEGRARAVRRQHRLVDARPRDRGRPRRRWPALPIHRDDQRSARRARAARRGHRRRPAQRSRNRPRSRVLRSRPVRGARRLRRRDDGPRARPRLHAALRPQGCRSIQGLRGNCPTGRHREEVRRAGPVGDPARR